MRRFLQCSYSEACMAKSLKQAYDYWQNQPDLNCVIYIRESVLPYIRIYKEIEHEHTYIYFYWWSLCCISNYSKQTYILYKNIYISCRSNLINIIFLFLYYMLLLYIIIYTQTIIQYTHFSLWLLTSCSVEFPQNAATIKYRFVFNQVSAANKRQHT